VELSATWGERKLRKERKLNRPSRPRKISTQMPSSTPTWREESPELVQMANALHEVIDSVRAVELRITRAMPKASRPLKTELRKMQTELDEAIKLVRITHDLQQTTQRKMRVLRDFAEGRLSSEQLRKAEERERITEEMRKRMEKAKRQREIKRRQRETERRQREIKINQRIVRLRYKGPR